MKLPGWILYLLLMTLPPTARPEAMQQPAKVLQQGALSLKLVPHGPQTVESFFIARGFSKEVAATIGQQCVFQIVIRNRATDPRNDQKRLKVSLRDWRIRQGKSITTLKLKEQWLQAWTQQGNVSRAALLAFRWATFPTEQVFEPVGDYAWGMVTMGLAPGESFALQVVWQQGDKRNEQWIENIHCPEDN